MSKEIQAPCKFFPCFNYATKKGYCNKHQPPEFINNRRKDLPKDWSVRRAYVIKRDKGVCYICGGKGADSADHIQPGNNHDYENLRACHQNVEPYCHRRKTSREANARKGVELKGERVAKKKPETIEWGF